MAVYHQLVNTRMKRVIDSTSAFPDTCIGWLDSHERTAGQRYPGLFASLPKTPSADHQRTMPCPVPSCFRSNLERRCSFHEKGISHNKRVHDSFCILRPVPGSFLRSGSFARVKMMQAADFWNLGHMTKRGRLDRSAAGCILFERQMCAAPFVVSKIISQSAS